MLNTWCFMDSCILKNTLVYSLHFIHHSDPMFGTMKFSIITRVLVKQNLSERRSYIKLHHCLVDPGACSGPAWTTACKISWGRKHGIWTSSTSWVSKTLQGLIPNNITCLYLQNKTQFNILFGVQLHLKLASFRYIKAWSFRLVQYTSSWRSKRFFSQRCISLSSFLEDCPKFPREAQAWIKGRADSSRCCDWAIATTVLTWHCPWPIIPQISKTHETL